MIQILPFLILAIFDLAGAICSPSQVAPLFVLRLSAGILVVAACGLGLARLGAPRASQFALALSRMWLAMLLLLIGTVYATPWTGGLADSWLSWPDGGRLGVSLSEWLQGEGLWGPAVCVYNSGLPFSFFFFAWLAWSRASELDRIPAAFCACGVVGLAMYLAAPAAGPQLDGRYIGCAAGAVPVWASIRAGVPHEFFGEIPGLIACPSFHSLSATLLLLSSRGRARLVVTAWWGTQIFTALTVGGHYLADLLVGISLASACWRLSGVTVSSRIFSSSASGDGARARPSPVVSS